MNQIYEINNKNLSALIGHKFKRIRINLNMTQRELSEKSGVALMSISGFESGRTSVSLTTLIQLLRTMNKLELIENSFLQPEPISPRLLFKIENKKRIRVRK